MKKLLLFFLFLLICFFSIISCQLQVEEKKSCTITFHANLDSAKGNMEKIVREENTTVVLTKNSFLCDGYEFLNWNTKSDGTGVKYEDCASIKIQNDLDLYAQWKLLPKKCTISFFANIENCNGIMEDILAEENTNIILPTNNFTSDEYKFVNWNTESNGSGITYESNTVINVTSNLKLYAQWKLKEKIEVTLSTELPTNQNITINIEIRNLALSEIGYVYSNNMNSWNDLVDVSESDSYTIIINNIDNVYSITANENGYYSILIKDSENNYYLKEVFVKNIDRIVPSVITNLNSVYNKINDEITLTWNNPDDTDFDYVNVSYTKNGTEVINNLHITDDFFTITNIDPDESNYTFNLCSVDKAGNKSALVSTTVIPPLEIIVKSITLDRYHLLSNDTNKIINVTVNLDNLQLLEDNTPVKIQIKDPSGSLTTKIATVDKVLGVATASITIPSTDEAAYIVMCKIGNESADLKHTARFMVSSSVNLKSIQQIYDGKTSCSRRIDVNSVENGIRENIKIVGNNLDLTNPAIQIFTSSGEVYFNEPIILDTSSFKWTESTGEIEQSVETIIDMPVVREDTYMVVVYFDGVLQKNTYGTIEIYDPNFKFTNFILPTVDVSKEDNKFKAKIFFNSDNYYNLSDFHASCPTNPNIVENSKFKTSIISNIEAMFTIPGEPGEYDITISFRGNSITKKLIVEDFSDYSIGDVFLRDGTVIHISQDLSFNAEQKSAAVAILAYFNDYGIPVWLGIKESYVEWAKLGTYASQNFISGITWSTQNYLHDNDSDGSDNWNQICLKDKFAVIEPEKYPAFYWANTYGNYYQINEEFRNGWYVPTMPELYNIEKNKHIINNILQALGAEQFDVSWSSNQVSGELSPNGYAWALLGEHGNCYLGKASKCWVRCIRTF